ncbi:MAG: hypothetical protein II467_07210 [Bacilli bacterium]|nr:hypothetical protein [Bacilli bacterium]
MRLKMLYSPFAILSFFFSLINLALAIVGTALLSEGFPFPLMVVGWVFFGVFLLLSIVLSLIGLIFRVLILNREEDK